jgi:deoxyribonuclease V
MIASRVCLCDSFSEEAPAGVDQAFLGELVISGAVVLDQFLKLRKASGCALKAAMPYVPGFLSFREGAAAVKAVRELDPEPSLLFVDGCGINHPRMAGLACFVGVLLDLPTVGITKSVLCGNFDQPENVGEAEPLIHEGDVVGYILSSKKGCRPIVVAPGHRITIDSALEATQRCLRGHKLPEPCRLAHEQARRIKAALSPWQGASLSAPAPMQNRPDLPWRPLDDRAQGSQRDSSP